MSQLINVESEKRHRLGVAFTFVSLMLIACNSGDESSECGGQGVICTYMGNGIASLGHDGDVPTEVSLYLPQDITWGPDREPYVMDWNNHRVRTLRDGKVATWIGTGELGDAPEGSRLETRLNHPTQVSFSPDGTMYLSAWHNSKVMKVAPGSSSIELVCGNGDRSYGGENVDPLDAILDLPVATAFDQDGSIYIMDQGNQRIRKIGSDGKINTVVGPVGRYLPDGFVEVCSEAEPEAGKAKDCKFCKEGSTFVACQGPPARPQGFASGAKDGREAFMNQPFSQSAPPSGGMEMGPDYRLIFVDTGNHLIRALEKDGTVTTVAGVEPEDYSATDLATKTPLGDFFGEDGSPATKARFNHPRDVAVAKNGTIFVADTLNSCVRKVTTDGNVYTVAGVCGEVGFEGDGDAATSALLDRPYGVGLDADGNLYIADTYNHRIRVVYGAAKGE